MYWTFKGQDFSSLWAEIQKANILFFPLILGVSVVFHIIRSLRWQLLLETEKEDHKTSLPKVFCALLVGYFANFIFPRSGEIARSYAIRDMEGVSFSYAMGSVVSERLIDILCFAFITVLAVFFQAETMNTFFQEKLFEPILGKWMNRAGFIWVVILFFGISFLIGRWLWKRFGEHQYGQKMKKGMVGLRDGILSIARMKYKWRFLVYTILIWCGYYLTTYLWFFGYDIAGEHLDMKAGLTLLAVGTLARSIPVQGQGLGTFHLLMAQAMALYSMSSLHANTLTMLIYSTQTAFYLGVGGICTLIYFYWRKK